MDTVTLPHASSRFVTVVTFQRTIKEAPFSALLTTAFLRLARQKSQGENKIGRDEIAVAVAVFSPSARADITATPDQRGHRP